MASHNSCTFLGNLGADPDVKYLTSGDAVANFSIACTEKWKDKATGETKEQTEWVRCVAFKRTAEIAGEYLKKGMPVLVRARYRNRKYQKDGQDHYITEFVVDDLVMLGSKSSAAEGVDRAQQQAEAYGRSGSNPQPDSRAAAPSNGGNAPFPDDDIPF